MTIADLVSLGFFAAALLLVTFCVGRWSAPVAAPAPIEDPYPRAVRLLQLARQAVDLPPDNRHPVQVLENKAPQDAHNLERWAAEFDQKPDDGAAQPPGAVGTVNSLLERINEINGDGLTVDEMIRRRDKYEHEISGRAEPTKDPTE